ncbi:hypothetical protein GA0061102_103727 [Rhizobium miluonense]|uniref:Uncharacterized protein n=1 Tax=Rhizobium miluonense TaxID=411945 RepID=A0A1C3WQW1_9HYPH|nr:hypothetical protein GA0061102_103727 [Rhizobium miluonense]
MDRLLLPQPSHMIPDILGRAGHPIINSQHIVKKRLQLGSFDIAINANRLQPADAMAALMSYPAACRMRDK